MNTNIKPTPTAGFVGRRVRPRRADGWHSDASERAEAPAFSPSRSRGLCRTEHGGLREPM